MQGSAWLCGFTSSCVSICSLARCFVLCWTGLAYLCSMLLCTSLDKHICDFRNVYVPSMCAAVDVHKIQHIDTLFTAAAIVAVGRSLPLLSQVSML